MTAETITKHLLLIAGLVIAFYISGRVGVFCEAQHYSLTMSTMIFGVSFTSIIAGLFKIYQTFTFYFFG